MAKLLLVDDDDDLCTIVSDQLTAVDHEVDIAATGAEAEQFLRDNHYDLLILDWDLPDTTGVEICRNFRSAGASQPVLMLTGHKAIEDKEEGFDAGADDYLTKPFDMKELAVRVRVLLRRSAATAKQAAGSTALDLQPGCVIAGKYRLEEYIGQGGMALVYRTTHLGMNKTVVVKLIKGHLLNEETVLKRFEQECQAMARINHPNVAAAFDTGVVNETQPYLVMEYVKGESLTDLITREGPLPVATACEILIQSCRGLEEAHAAGIVHRDLKPDNILLKDRHDRPDWVKIVDFGLAHLLDSSRRLTEPNIVMGSAGYMAPEQLRGVPGDERTDIYSLGVILFRMLTKDLPFRAVNTEAFLVKQLLEEPELLSDRCPNIARGSPLDLIVTKALEKEPDRRYQTVAAMRRELEHHLKNLTQEKSR